MTEPTIITLKLSAPGRRDLTGQQWIPGADVLVTEERRHGQSHIVTTYVRSFDDHEEARAFCEGHDCYRGEVYLRADEPGRGT